MVVPSVAAHPLNHKLIAELIMTPKTPIQRASENVTLSLPANRVPAIHSAEVNTPEATPSCIKSDSRLILITLQTRDLRTRVSTNLCVCCISNMVFKKLVNLPYILFFLQVQQIVIYMFSPVLFFTHVRVHLPSCHKRVFCESNFIIVRA